jgi:hypothetical protein
MWSTTIKVGNIRIKIDDICVLIYRNMEEEYKFELKMVKIVIE